MAAARKSRREFDQIETLVRLGAAGAILLALAVGGLANFLPALGAVLVLVLALALLNLLQGKPHAVTTTGRDSRATVEVAEAAYRAEARETVVHLPIEPLPWR